MITLDHQLQVYPGNILTIEGGFVHNLFLRNDSNEKYTFAVREKLEIDAIDLRQNRSNYWEVIPDGLASPEAIIPAPLALGMVMYLFGRHIYINPENVKNLVINVSKLQTLAVNYSNPKQETIVAINHLWPYANIKDGD